MIGARKLLRDSINFLFNNPVLIFYGFIYFLPILIAMISVILLALSVGTISLITFSFSTIIQTVFITMFGGVVSVLLMIVFFFTLVVGSLGLTIYIQDLLAGNHASVMHSLKKSWVICLNVWWVVPMYLLYFFIGNSSFWIFSFIAFCYIPQLLIDGETSLPDAFSRSWDYFKKSFLVLLRFFILIFLGVISAFLIGVSSLVLAGFFVPVPGASLLFLSLSVVIFFGLFLFWITGSMISIIGINKMYLYIKKND